jgi:uncharacterized protein DUF4276
LIIQSLVEGKGEVEALPVLLRRLRDESGAYLLSFDRPIRRSRSEFIKEKELRNAIQLALRSDRGCDGILILFDGDKDCPKELAPLVGAWARAEAAGVQCEVVIAQHEYEAWFLGSLESLRECRGIRADSRSRRDPESIRGAKEKLEAAMTQGYAETADQPAFTARFDLAAAYRSCRSFRRMVHAFGLLAAAAGAEIGDWPPPSWL